MNDDIWRRREIKSPCVKVCVIHPSERICTGCYRTIDEIGAWSRMGDAEREEIMTALPDRAGRLAQRRGGRRGRIGGD